MTVFLVFTKYFGNISFLGAYATREGAEAFVQALTRPARVAGFCKSRLLPDRKAFTTKDLWLGGGRAFFASLCAATI